VIRPSVTLRAQSQAWEKAVRAQTTAGLFEARASAPRSRLLTAATTGGSLSPALALRTYAPKPTTAATAAAASAGRAQRDLGLANSEPKVPRLARGGRLTTDTGPLVPTLASARRACSAATTSFSRWGHRLRHPRGGLGTQRGRHPTQRVRLRLAVRAVGDMRFGKGGAFRV
jgi:hypothetical protein